MFCAGYAEDIAGVLEDDVLKASAGAEQRDFAFTGGADCKESAVHVFVRAARSDPDASGLGETIHRIGSMQVVSGDPARFDVQAKRSGRVPNGLVGNGVGTIVRIEIGDDGESGGAHAKMERARVVIVKGVGIEVPRTDVRSYG